MSECLLSLYPDIRKAIKVDGAIRILDGRWSGGFVDKGHLKTCLDMKWLVIEHRRSMAFAVLQRK